MPATRSALLPLTLTTVLALAGCAGAERSTDDAAPAGSAPATSAPTPTGTAAATPTGTTAPVPATLDFTARTIDGGQFTGGSLAGKPAVLWFWAAWCTRCRGVADDVAAVRRDNASRINLIGVAGLGSGADAMRRFARDTGIAAFPNLADDDGAVWRRFGVSTQEWYVLLDSAGKVVHSGALSQAELRRRVAELS
ncbi:redoxin domain-containing protein [Micromonospora sp. DR5-3]|uniref:redoxin domain-containing protein n=1 Tax=unclassified Micromonospora TaxID=2617518 RepID=UPI0011D72B86|nr:MULTISPECIES: redoxin domain-containing protein [unclassified Micromonospora]MCW3813282.1 redoxin domain-containing protein [Micromonospora sp. DR5-3]TYC24671.1 redoxin domain-containing protein [Micromonospora sp. MP36]